MFSDPRRDAHRFADALRAAVADGRARDHRKFRAWAAKVDARPRPKGDPLAPRKRGRSNAEKGGRAAADEQALVAQIRRAPGAVLHTLSCAHPAGLHAADPCEVSCRIHTKKEERMPATAWLLRGARNTLEPRRGPVLQSQAVGAMCRMFARPLQALHACIASPPTPPRP